MIGINPEKSMDEGKWKKKEGDERGLQRKEEGGDLNKYRKERIRAFPFIEFRSINFVLPVLRGYGRGKRTEASRNWKETPQIV